MAIDELLAYILDGQPHLFSEPMAMWLGASRRYVAFVTTFRDKIRKKLRTTQDQESLLDLRLELETAYLLLRERALSLVYEPEQAGRQRGPDFAVTFTTSLTFMLEVTRVRPDSRSIRTEHPEPTLAPGANGVPNTERLVDAICSKLGQLMPQRSNVLLVGMENMQLTDDGLRATMLRLQQRAEGDDLSFLQRYRFRDRADFFRQYQRLSEILVRDSHLQAPGRPVVWINPQAKYPLSSKVRTTLYRSQAG